MAIKSVFSQTFALGNSKNEDRNRGRLAEVKMERSKVGTK